MSATKSIESGRHAVGAALMRFSGLEGLECLKLCGIHGFYVESDCGYIGTRQYADSTQGLDNKADTDFAFILKCACAGQHSIIDVMMMLMYEFWMTGIGSSRCFNRLVGSSGSRGPHIIWESQTQEVCGLTLFVSYCTALTRK